MTVSLLESLQCSIGDIVSYVPKSHGKQADDVRTKGERAR